MHVASLTEIVFVPVRDRHCSFPGPTWETSRALSMPSTRSLDQWHGERLIWGSVSEHGAEDVDRRLARQMMAALCFAFGSFAVDGIISIPAGSAYAKPRACREIQGQIRTETK